MKHMFTTMIAAGLLALSSIASAATIDFNLDFAGLSGGTLLGETEDWATGENIRLDMLQVSGAAGMVEGEVLEANLTNGLLNFNTANNTFTITGAVNDNGLVVADTVLFSGTFFDWTYADYGFMESFFATGSGTVGIDLLTALGETAEANPFAFGGFSIESNDGVVNSTDYLLSSTTPRTPEVPVPAAFWLMGSGLLGLVGVARRKV